MMNETKASVNQRPLILFILLTASLLYDKFMRALHMIPQNNLEVLSFHHFFDYFPWDRAIR